MVPDPVSVIRYADRRNFSFGEEYDSHFPLKINFSSGHFELFKKNFGSLKMEFKKAEVDDSVLPMIMIIFFFKLKGVFRFCCASACDSMLPEMKIMFGDKLKVSFCFCWRLRSPNADDNVRRQRFHSFMKHV
jgi:hypothetical protein